MEPVQMAGVVFACVFGGAMTGMLVGRLLPPHHVAGDSKDAVKVGIGMVATMTALILGLVTASAKSAFDAQDSAVHQTAATVVVLDRTLANWGPETAAVRRRIKDVVAWRLIQVWPEHAAGVERPGSGEPQKVLGKGGSSGAQGRQIEEVDAQIRNLPAQGPGAQILQARALHQCEALMNSAWMAFGASIPGVQNVFLVVLSCWLTVIFWSFGLFAPRNLIVVLVFLICAVSVAAAIFLILEMESPFDGFVKVSGGPIRMAYEVIGK